MEKVIESNTALFERAKKSIPGGVNSPVRAFKSVGGSPVFMSRAKGAWLFDTEGNRYIDFINSWGPMILGHGRDEVVEAMNAKLRDAISFGAPTELEIEMAELIKSMVPNVDMVRLVSSGTEACMSALRLARGFTGRNKFIKFEGCYHGHADAFLVKAGSGMATFNIQNVAGITAGVAGDTLTAPFNDIEAVKKLIAENPDSIAAIITEPVVGNMGCILPNHGYLEALRNLCSQHKILLIFDEVMTGFRLAPGGAQQKLNINADIVTYGKVLGGGMPVAAFGGRKEIMEHIAPLGRVYQAGTLSGNPVAVSCGFATLSILKNNPSIYLRLKEKGTILKNEISSILSQKSLAHTINQCGSMMSVHFGNHAVTDLESASKSDSVLFNKFFHHMLKGGVYLPPSAFESWFFSDALGDAEIDHTLSVLKKF